MPHHFTYLCILTDVAASVATCPTRMFLRRESHPSPLCAKYRQAFLPYTNLDRVVISDYNMEGYIREDEKPTWPFSHLHLFYVPQRIEI